MQTRARLLQLLGAAGTAAAVGRLPAAAAPPPAKTVSASQALARLKAGNARFVAGTMTNQNDVIERRLALTGGQAPFAMLLACSDSRVGPELLFDQRVGDLFVIRNAGNFVTDGVLGTLEYGYSVLGAKLIVVMAHESCGAVSATYDAIKTGKPLPPHLDAIEQGISAGITATVNANGSKNAAAIANAKAQAARVGDLSPILQAGITKGDLRVVAADYHLGTGHITIVG